MFCWAAGLAESAGATWGCVTITSLGRFLSQFCVFKYLSNESKDVFIHFTKHMVQNPSPKAICSLKPNLIQVVFLHYKAISWAEDMSDLHLSTTCALSFCTTKVKPVLPYMLQLDNTLFRFRLCISSGKSTPEQKDTSLLSPSAHYPAQEHFEASLAAKNTVPNNSADRSTCCHFPSFWIPSSQPQPPSSAPSFLPKLVLLQ